MKYVAQVGGAHYEHGRNLENQHWDLMDRWDIQYLPATASKYIVRWDFKGTPILDLGKSISYVTKQLMCHPYEGCRRTVPHEFMEEWFGDNDLHIGVPRQAEKRLLMELIHVDGSPLALNSALIHLREILARESNERRSTSA